MAVVGESGRQLVSVCVAWPMIDTTLHDLRQAFRVLASNRTFAALSVLCLSLGIGTNTTAFTFVNALLLQPLPLAEPNRLVSLHEVRGDDPGHTGPVSYPNFLDWRVHAAGLGEMAAQRTIDLRLSDGGPLEREAGALVSWNLFSLLGIRPELGRGFLEEEDRIGGTPVVLLSHALWQRRYHEDPAVIGREIIVNGTPRTVIGIMPAGLSQIALDRVLRGARLWVPIGSVEQNSRRDERVATVFARLANGVTRDMAGARLSTVAETLGHTYPSANDGWGAVVQPLRIGFSPSTRAMILMMMGALTFVLLIACANAATLTLARATGRRREMATRLALGAPRHRIVRQLLTESLLVGIASIPAGVAFAYWGRNLVLGGQVRPDLHAEIAIDSRVLAYTIGLAMLTSLLSGLLPALRAVRHLQPTVLTTGGGREDASGPRHARLTHLLIIGEVSLALMLLIGASLFVQSFRNALQAEGGFDTSRILNVRLPESTGPQGSHSLRVTEAVDQLRALPGVTHAAAANLMPLRTAGDRIVVVPDGLQGSPEERPTVLLGGVTSDFFRVLNIPIVQGRMFTDAEGGSRTAVAVVNRTMAGRLWPGQNPIGRRFQRAGDDDARWFTIVGVSDDILTWDLSDRPQPTAYVPYTHVPVQEPGLFIRASGDPSLLAPSVRAAIHAMNPNQPLFDVRTMTEVHHEALSRMQTLASLFIVVGGIALLLSAMGVYGVLSYFVTQRTYEIGIRAALGADRRALVGFFVRQGMTIAFAGIALGVAGAWALARAVRGLLHEVDPTDPLSFVGAALVLSAVGFLAIYIPARRAAKVDPLIAIRN